MVTDGRQIGRKEMPEATSICDEGQSHDWQTNFPPHFLFFFLIFIYFFIQLCRVLVAARGIFIAACGIF